MAGAFSHSPFPIRRWFIRRLVLCAIFSSFETRCLVNVLEGAEGAGIGLLIEREPPPATFAAPAGAISASAGSG
jgi:hypothetical protein